MTQNPNNSTVTKVVVVRDLSNIEAMVENKVYKAVIGIAEREECTGKYLGNGHHFAQQISQVCVRGFLTYLPTIFEKIGQIMSKSLSVDELKDWLQGSFSFSIRNLISQEKTYKGNSDDLTREMSAECAKYILPVMPLILKDIADVFLEEGRSRNA